MTTLLEADVSRETFEGLDATDNDIHDAIPGAKTGDPDAPYGFTESGTPRRKPGRRPGQRTGTGKAAVKTIPAPTKKAIPKPPAPKKTQVDYRPAMLKLGGEFIGTAAIWGLMKDDVRILADTATVANAFPHIVEGLNTAADKWPLVASILDRVLPMAEFASSGGALVLMAAQLCVNHGVMPPGLIPGTASPERVVTAFIEQQMKANPEFAETVAAIQLARSQSTPSPAA